MSYQNNTQSSPSSGIEVILSSLTPTVGTGATPTTKINSSPTLVGGDYLVDVSFLWAYDNNATDFAATLQINGVFQGQSGLILRQEPKDSDGADTIPGSGTDQMHSYGQMFLVTLPAGAVNFTLEFTGSDGSFIRSMANAIIVITKL